MNFLSAFFSVFFILYANSVAIVQNDVEISRPKLPSRTWTTYVTMRDGIKLHTRMLVPKDYDETKKYTVIMDRSPYGQFGIELLADLFVPAGFVTVCQDMRGTGLSEGNFTNWKGDADDSQDTGDWVVKQPWSNGVIYTFGASADGLGAFTTNYNAPVWLSSQYYIWASSIGYDVLFPNGALLYNLLWRWLVGTVREDDVERCWNEFMQNEARTSWWDDLTFTGQYQLVKDGKFGFWAGWYDIFLVGNLAAYQGYNYEASPSARYSSVLLVDPCGHCQDAAAYFTEDIVAGRTALGLMQAYDVFGSRPVKRTNIHNVTFYVMSSNDEAGTQAGQYWTSVDAFPRPVMTKFYLHSDGMANVTLPSKSSSPDFTSFVFDPTNPQPTNGGNNLWSDAPCGPLDQQELDKRADVIVFQTATFTEELPLTGAINGHLYVSSDAIDTDFMVRVSDVYPTGEARLIQDSAVRMRWREGTTDPLYMTPGGVYPAYISLWNTSYVLAPGHALRFAISSSNYPRFSVNRNNGILLADPTYPGPNITATNSVYHSRTYPSYVELPIVSKSSLPRVHSVKEEFEAAYPNVNYELVIKKGPRMLEKISLLTRRN